MLRLDTWRTVDARDFQRYAPGMRILLSLLLLSLPLSLAAQVYRYVDEKGVVHYSDKAPSKDAKPIVLPKLQTVPALAPTAPSSSESSPAAAQRSYKVAITSPVPDQTYRDPGASITVSASVTPELADGDALMFYVDGAPAGSAGRGSNGFTLSGLERGEHSIAAAVVDADGRELVRSASVRVHLLLPGRIKPAGR